MTLQEKRTLMLSLVDRWKTSGMSQADLARAHQVNLAKFCYWINAQRKGTIESMPAFIELNGFSHQDISIRYPNGVELVLPAQTPVVVLLFFKRLERGTLELPTVQNPGLSQMLDYGELAMIITGISMKNANKRVRFFPQNSVDKHL